MSLFSKIAFGIAGILISRSANAQQTFNPENYQQEQTNLQRKGMYVLAGWSAVNMLSGAYFSGHTEGSTQYFHRMNLYWNAVNGVLSVAALYRLAHQKKQTSFASVYKKQQSLEKTFLLNAGLDVAYMTAGALLLERGKNKPANRDKYKGFGKSVIVQGGFLLLFDGIMYGLLHHKGKTLDKVLEKVEVAPTANGVSLSISL